MRNAKAAEMDFSGAKPQTSIFDNDVSIQQKNIEITEAFIEGLGSPRVSENKTGLFWTDVKLEKIMSELLNLSPGSPDGHTEELDVHYIRSERFASCSYIELKPLATGCILYGTLSFEFKDSGLKAVCELKEL